MDAPVETQLLELTSDARHARNDQTELAYTQSSPDEPSPTRTLTKRKSLRLRPIDPAEEQHVVPPLPLRTYASQPELRPRPSKMSLFSLFSKPKVEKLRGYAEPGLEKQPWIQPQNVAPSRRKASIQDDQTERGTTRPAMTHAQSARVSRLSRKEPAQTTAPVLQAPADRRTFEPLPWFQVLPQAILHGTFEVSTIVPDVVLQKHRQKTATNAFHLASGRIPEDGATSRGSVDSKAATRTTMRSGSISARGGDTVKKSFVLVTSGYLLQYPENGGNDRMPEKILKLGRDSAAFASDLVPGRHHVLQVSHAIDAQGGLMGDRQSIFAKFSLRNHTPRRMVSNFLIIMPGAEELGQWQTSIRNEVQRQGGKMTRPESSTSQHARANGLPKLDLQKTPSQSHRYQVKRDPSKVLSVISPLGDTFSWFPSPLEGSEGDPLAKSAAAAEEPPAREDTEMIRSRPRAQSDSPSLTSSAGQSVEQQQLETLRDSTRISHTSTAATMSTYPSRSNSLTSSPLADLSGDAIDGDTRSPVRGLPSHSMTKRRSGVPIALNIVPALSSPEDLLLQRRRMPALPLAVTPMMSPVPELASPRQRLSAARSVPDFHEKRVRNDSKVASPSSPRRARPESFLGDLPDTTTWASKTSPSYQRTSFAQQSPIRERPATAQPMPNGRASQSFSLPLRVNPTATARRMSSRVAGEEDVLSPVPVVHTLSAKVNAAERDDAGMARLHGRRPSVEPRRASAGLSLFPTGDTTASQQSQAAAASAMLRRPASLQVRNPDQAAFLASSRAYPTPRMSLQQRSVTTIPIRRLKPSRSLQTIPSESAPRNFSRQASLSAADEGDRATSLSTDRRPSLPAQLHLLSRARATSIVPGDFSFPLGPPAPPPRAPLPELPPPGMRSRSRSPMPRGIGLAIGEEPQTPSPLSAVEG